MTRWTGLLVVVAFLFAPLAHARDQEELRKLYTEAESSAKAASAKGDYAKAAKTIEGALKSFGKELETIDRKDLDAAAVAYRDRAKWSKTAAKSAPDARKLLRSLLFPSSYRIDGASLDDPRIAPLFSTLRAKDPAFAAFFRSGAAVKLEVKPSEKFPAPAAKAFEVAALQELRRLGFQASTDAGAEVFSVSLEPDEKIDMSKVDSHGMFSASTVAGASSCGIVAHASWSRDSKAVIEALDLSTRDMSFTAKGCEVAPAKKAGRSVAIQLVRRWFDDHPDPL